MRTLIQEFWDFVLRRRQHPIYQRERTGYSYVGLWKKLRSGCLPLMALVVVLPACTCGLITLAFAGELGTSALPVIGLAAVFGLFAGGQWLLWGAGMLATALTGSTISAEIETQSYALLRMTSIPPRHVVLAKFSAVLAEVRPAIWLNLVIRLIVPPAGLFFVVLLLFLIPDSGGAAPSSGIPVTPSITGVAPTLALLPFLFGLANIGLTVISVAVMFVIGLVFYFIQPFLEIMFYAAVGIFGSTFARTRGNGLFTAIGFRMALGALSYAIGQFIGFAGQIALFPVALNPQLAEWISQFATSNPGIMVVIMVGIYAFWIVFIIAYEYGLTLLLLHWTTRRAERLPFNQK